MWRDYQILLFMENNVGQHRGNLPRHDPLLQSSVSRPAPEQSTPSPEGGGLVQVRVRFRCPSPHRTLQGR